MVFSSVNDVGLFDTPFQGIHTALYFRYHPALDGAVMDQTLVVLHLDRGDQLPIRVEHPFGVCQEHQLPGLQGGGNRAGHQVCVDIVSLSPSSCTHRGYYRYKLPLQEIQEHTVLDRGDLTHHAHVDDFRWLINPCLSHVFHLLGGDELSIFA